MRLMVYCTVITSSLTRYPLPDNVVGVLPLHLPGNPYNPVFVYSSIPVVPVAVGVLQIFTVLHMESVTLIHYFSTY